VIRPSIQAAGFSRSSWANPIRTEADKDCLA